MLKRLVALLFAGMFLVGAAACGDDDDGDDAIEETTDGGSSSDDGGDDTSDDSGDDASDDGGDDSEPGSSDEAVEAYCADAEALAAELESAGDDPAALAELMPQLTALQESSQDLAARAADLDEADGERLTECSETLSDAAASLSAN